MEIQDYLKQKKELVWSRIDQYLTQYQEEDLSQLKKSNVGDWQKYLPLLKEHWWIMREYPERKGKYVRPGILLLMVEAMGGSVADAINTAAAMQVSEDWILIHDDWEDDSMERRGGKTLHRMYPQTIAVNAGDGLHDMMHRILYENIDILGASRAREVFHEFSKMLSRTIFGQYVELFWTIDNKQNMSDEDVYFTMSGKTVYYTIAGPLRLGAIIAGATKSQLDLLFDFGCSLGICFQIKDDILDLTSDFSGMKKQNLNDIYEGKRTIMLAHLMRMADRTELDYINSILQKSRIDKKTEEVEEIKRLMISYGSIEYAQEKAEWFAGEALRKLDAMDFFVDTKWKGLFTEMVEFILHRTT